MITSRRTLNSQTVFDAGFLKLVKDEVRLPDGATHDYYLIKHPGASAVVPIDDRGRIMLVRQHRQAIGMDLLEVPAGKLDPGEEPAACARRELMEESGYACEELTLLTSFYTSPGFTDEIIHVYAASGLSTEGQPPTDDEGEQLSLEWLDQADALAAVRKGRITDGKTIVGITLLGLAR